MFKLKVRGSWGLCCINHHWRWRSYEKSEMGWLNQRSSQSSLGPSVPSFCMLDHLMLCNVLWGSRMCVSYAWEISPTLIGVPTFYLTKKNKKKQTRALLVETLEILSFIIIITFIFVIYYYYYYYLFHFMGSPNFLSFSINKAKVKFEK